MSLHTENNHTAPHTAQRAESTRYRVPYRQELVYLSINIISTVDSDSVNERQLALAIYVQFKVKIFRGSHVSTKIFSLNVIISEIFSVG